MRMNWNLGAVLAAFLCFFATMAFVIDRSEQRAHEAKMASCTTTISKTDSARVGQ